MVHPVSNSATESFMKFSNSQLHRQLWKNVHLPDAIGDYHLSSVYVLFDSKRDLNLNPTLVPPAVQPRVS